jgi:hypothetical protein
MNIYCQDFCSVLALRDSSLAHYEIAQGIERTHRGSGSTCGRAKQSPTEPKDHAAHNPDLTGFRNLSGLSALLMGTADGFAYPADQVSAQAKVQKICHPPPVRWRATAR